jgi:hypothetical protein
LGLSEYFRRLLQILGITLEKDLSHYLAVKQTKRATRLAKIRTNEKKKKIRNKQKQEKLMADTKIATKERQKRAGTYKSGQNMDDEEDDAD